MYKVRVNAGRYRGDIGTVVELADNGDVLVDFGRDLSVDEGFGSVTTYQDSYWVKKQFVCPVHPKTNECANLQTGP